MGQSPPRPGRRPGDRVQTGLPWPPHHGHPPPELAGSQIPVPLECEGEELPVTCGEGKARGGVAWGSPRRGPALAHLTLGVVSLSVAT